MTELAAQKSDVGGVGWFTVMVGMWSAFSTLLIVSPETLADVWRWLTDLPLALAVWQSSWEDWLRLLLIALLGAFWTMVSAPRAKA